jgi:rhamnose transport system permease protein
MSSATPTAPDHHVMGTRAMRRATRKKILGRWETLIFGLILVVLVIGSQLSDQFLSTASLTSGSAGYVEFALLALPLTLIIATGEIDLSVASVLGLSSAIMGELWNQNVPIELIFPIVLVVGALCGLINGWLITKLGLPSLAVTIATLSLYRGLAFVVLGDESVTSFPDHYTTMAYDNFAGTFIPNPVMLFIVLAIVFAVVLHRTPFGRSIFAIGASPEAARFSGLRVNRTKLQLYVISGVVAALAGIVVTLRDSTAAGNVGTGAELTAIAAVVLGGVSIFGGTGTIGGVLLALFLLSGIQKAIGLNPDVPTYWIQIISGALLIGSVLVPNLLTRLRESRQINQRRGPARSSLDAPPTTAPGTTTPQG